MSVDICKVVKMSNELEECKLSQRKAIWELVKFLEESLPDLPKGEINKRIAEKTGLSHRTVAIYRQEMGKLLNIENSKDSLQFTTAGCDKDHVLAKVPPEKRKAVIAEAKKEPGRITAKKLEKAAEKVVGAHHSRHKDVCAKHEAMMNRIPSDDIGKSKSPQRDAYMFNIKAAIDNLRTNANDALMYVRKLGKNNADQRKMLKEELNGIIESLSHIIETL